MVGVPHVHIVGVHVFTGLDVSGCDAGSCRAFRMSKQQVVSARRGGADSARGLCYQYVTNP
jgi:hypothetical protein